MAKRRRKTQEELDAINIKVIRGHLKGIIAAANICLERIERLEISLPMSSE